MTTTDAILCAVATRLIVSGVIEDQKPGSDNVQLQKAHDRARETLHHVERLEKENAGLRKENHFLHSIIRRVKQDVREVLPRSN